METANSEQKTGGSFHSAPVVRSAKSAAILLIIAATIIGVSCRPCLAADTLDANAGNHWWIGAGFGMGSFRTDFALASNVGLCLQDGHNIYTFRFNHVSGIPGSIFTAAPSNMREYGFMYGRALVLGASYATLSAGVGWSVEKTSRLGFPVEAALYAGQLNWVGITLKLCMNITPGPGPSRSYWCVVFGLLLGKIH